MPGLITPDLPEPNVPTGKTKKIIATILTLGVFLVAAPTAAAGFAPDPNQVNPNPGWEVD